jgi:hypothetical protein
MKTRAFAVAALSTALALVCPAMSVHGGAQQTRAPLPLEPLGTSEEAVFPAFEGWGPLKDGEKVFLLGYYNRNKDQALDIPIGPDNQIEPGGPDYGQPTHFETGRQHGVFTIRVPKDFGTRKLTWTLTASGQASIVSFWLNPGYYIDFFKHHANGNQPPVIRFASAGATLTGPPHGVAQTLSGRVREPVTLRLWASDPPTLLPDLEDELAARNNRPPDAGRAEPVAIIGGRVIGAVSTVRDAGAAAAPADITIRWRKHRGPGHVTFAHDRVPLVTGGDPNLFLEATTTATFDAPGQYVLRAQVNDSSGDGGSGMQCCWTTAHVNVTVR